MTTEDNVYIYIDISAFGNKTDIEIKFPFHFEVIKYMSFSPFSVLVSLKLDKYLGVKLENYPTSPGTSFSCPFFL